MAFEAVGLVLLLLERPLVDLFEAEGADEVLGVKLPEHGRDAAARDQVLARGADVLTHRDRLELGLRNSENETCTLRS